MTKNNCAKIVSVWVLTSACCGATQAEDGGGTVDVNPYASPADVQVRVVPLEHANCSDVAKSLGYLFHRTGGPRKVSSYPQNNSVLLRGVPDELDQMEAIAKQLDVEPPPAETPKSPEKSTHIVEFEHANAEQIAAVINSYCQASGYGSSKRRGFKTSVSVIVVERLNSVILRGPQQHLDDVVSLLRRLDVPLKSAPRDNKQ